MLNRKNYMTSMGIPLSVLVMHSIIPHQLCSGLHKTVKFVCFRTRFSKHGQVILRKRTFTASGRDRFPCRSAINRYCRVLRCERNKR